MSTNESEYACLQMNQNMDVNKWIRIFMSKNESDYA